MVAPHNGASSPNVTPIASESHEAEVDLRESYCIFLGGAVISSYCRQQGCIAMSTTEAELVALVALAVCAIELIALIGVLKTLGYEVDEPVDVGTDNKGAYDLCHRFTSAQHSRHIDRKLFKMREKRGAGQVCVRYVPTNDNTSDISCGHAAVLCYTRGRR